MSVESLMFINLFSHLLKSTTKYFISRVMHSTATDWSRSRYWNLMLKQRKINKLNDLKGCTAAGSLSSVFFVGYFFRHSTIPRCIVLYHILGNLIIKYPHQQLQCDENLTGTWPWKFVLTVSNNFGTKNIYYVMYLFNFKKSVFYPNEQ